MFFYSLQEAAGFHGSFGDYTENNAFLHPWQSSYITILGTDCGFGTLFTLFLCL